MLIPILLHPEPVSHAQATLLVAVIGSVTVFPCFIVNVPHCLFPNYD